MENLSEFIKKLKSNPKLFKYDEAATKQALIIPLIQLLGWDPFNIEEVTPEYTVENKRVDFSLRLNNTNEYFIEVKKTSEDLERHQEQLLDYSFRQGVELAALTNGITWWFYLPTKKGDWQERKFYAVDILQQDTEDISRKFVDFLAKENVENGKALKNAESIYTGKRKNKLIEKTLPEAWNKIIIEPDSLLIELLVEITEKLCGFQPENDKVVKFLRTYKDQFMLLTENIKKSSSTIRTPHYPSQFPQGKAEIIKHRKKGRKGYNQLDHYIFPVIRLMKKGTNYSDAFHIIAKDLNVTYSTVGSQCSRQLGISTDEFIEYVNSGQIVRLLKKRYPDKIAIIKKELDNLIR